MMTVVVMAADGLGQILNIGKLAALRSGAEVRCQLGQLACRRRVAIRLGGLRGGLQVSRDLLGHLGIFGRILLLQLLQLAQELRQRRQLRAAILRRGHRRGCRVAAGGRSTGRTARIGICHGVIEERLEVIVRA